MASDLSEELIDSVIGGSFGRPFRFLDVTDSTNEQALQWLAEGAPEGALVVADHQTAGRGRRGRAWASRPGDSLLFSVVLRPRGRAQVVELLTTAVGIACARGIERSCGLRVGLKWPNDIMVSEAKLAGILVESRVRGGVIAGAVAGVGINVRWPAEDLTEDFATPATSLAVAARAEPSATVAARSDILGAVIDSLAEVYASLATADGCEEVRREAEERSTVIGREVSVRFADGSAVSGRATELTSSGALVLARADGASVILGVGEIEQLRRT